MDFSDGNHLLGLLSKGMQVQSTIFLGPVTDLGMILHSFLTLFNVMLFFSLLFRSTRDLFLSIFSQTMCRKKYIWATFIDEQTLCHSGVKMIL